MESLWALLAVGLALLGGGGVVMLWRQVTHRYAALTADMAKSEDRIEHLERSLDLAHDQLDRLRQDIARLGGSTSERIDAEVGVVKGLLSQLTRMLDAKRAPAAIAAPVLATPVARDNDLEILGLVRRALDDDRIDLFLQPIVALPQRRIRFFEAFSRLRDDAGDLVRAEAYRDIAERAGLLATIDNLLLVRCIQLVRRVKERNRAVGFFCNVTTRMFADAEFFDKFLDFLGSNQDLSRDLIFEFKASDFLGRDADVDARLKQLAALGFVFSLDRVDDAALDPVDLTRAHVRFVKIDAGYLMSREAQSRSGIVLTDLKTALARGGIALIASKIEDERTVVNLQDYDIDFGQGYLFGEPRLSREYV